MIINGLALQRSKFIVFDLLKNEILGHYHRGTESNVYYYPSPAPNWSFKNPGRAEKRVRRSFNIQLIYNDLSCSGFHAFFDHKTENSMWVHLKLTPEKVPNVLDRLEIVLGKNNFVLSSHNNLNKRINFGIHSIICKTPEDAVIASLVMNQS